MDSLYYRSSAMFKDALFKFSYSKKIRMVGQWHLVNSSEIREIDIAEFSKIVAGHRGLSEFI